MARKRKGYSTINSILGGGGGGGGRARRTRTELGQSTGGGSPQTPAMRSSSPGGAAPAGGYSRSVPGSTQTYRPYSPARQAKPPAPIGSRGSVVGRVSGQREKSPSSLLERLDREFGPDERISEEEAALLAEAFGLPGKTYGEIAIGESALRPGAESDDGGFGLWQMTPRVQSPETKAAWDKIASEHEGGYKNPVANARMAAYLAGDSTGVSNYYGTGYVTDENAHLRGGQARAKKLLGMPAKGVGGPRQLGVSELYYDPGINISDGQETSPIGGHGTHVHFASTKPRDVLTAARIAQRKGLEVRENPLFDPVDPVHTGGSYHYRSTTLPRGLRDLARKLGGSGSEIGEAIDVSGGDAGALAAFNRAIARRSGAPIGPSTGSLAGYGGTSGAMAAGGAGFSALAARDQRATSRSGGGRIYSPATARSLLSPSPRLAETATQSASTLLAQLAESGPNARRIRPRRRITDYGF